MAWAMVVGTAVATAALLLVMTHRWHPTAELVTSVILIYLSIAPRDLSVHAGQVERALAQADVGRAQHAVGQIVGRDTDLLDSAEVSRAAVEAVAESTLDGVTAPLFWACVLGPLGAVAYRATNTLDSMWGHLDQRYRSFGWVAARADDLAGWLPARLTVGWIALAATLLGQRGSGALRAAMRDGPRHASPNAGLGEAAYAGALGVRLGGRNRYQGEWNDGPRFGSSDTLPSPRTIRLAVRLMWATTVVAWLTLSGLSVLFAGWSHEGLGLPGQGESKAEP